MTNRKIITTDAGYQLNALRDVPDLRDWPFEPSLGQLKRYIHPPRKPLILDQQQEGACTGFGLAAIINMLNQQRGQKTHVSPRMLYEMAKQHDEWPGEGYAGSSCRGAIKGWFNMGVCQDSKWKYESNKPGFLSVDRAKNARENTIGAYYRVQPRISDFHAALNELGAIYCSAKTHAGWHEPHKTTHIIPFKKEATGGHAFAIVGYNSKGFWIQNSWSEQWGKEGLALWTYEDWHQNMMDAWVFNLALSTPQIWHLPNVEEQNRSGESRKASPARSEIAGHFIHVDDGQFHTQGKYWSNADDVSITAKRLTKTKGKYKHLLLYAHGGLNSPKDSARRIAAMKQTFKENGIYPYHFMYDTGILEELGDIILRRNKKVENRVGGATDWTDKILEWVTRIPGRALWREMKSGAKRPFGKDAAGSQTLAIFMSELAKLDKDTELKVHIVGHSTGAILLANLLKSLSTIAPKMRVASCSLLAPACTATIFRECYYPHLAAKTTVFGIDKMQIFNLNDTLEQDDQVGGVYRKSLLYLVSKAFEEDTPEKILGMKIYSDKVLTAAERGTLSGRFALHYSDGASNKHTQSTTHGGFDNDIATMNTILETVLGKKPKVPFTDDVLKQY